MYFVEAIVYSGGATEWSREHSREVRSNFLIFKLISLDFTTMAERAVAPGRSKQGGTKQLHRNIYE